MRFRKTGFLITAFLLLLQFTGFGQDSSNVTWNAVGIKTGDGQYEIRIQGTIRAGWHVYTKLNEAIDLAGLELTFSDSSILKEGNQVIQGNLKTIADKIFETQAAVAEENVEIVQRIKLSGAIPASIKARLLYNTASDSAFIPEEKKIDIKMEGGVDMSSTNRILVPTIDLKNPVNDCGEKGISADETASKGLLSIFGLGFLGGLVALILPCLFPMIPLTVSFFTKKATTRKKGVTNAFLYGFFIFLIYILLSLPFHFLDKLNPDILNNISTNVYLNVIFFAVFLFFAFSFFGYYEITLPSGISNSADSKAGTGNVLGIFFMALTLAIISFSCTGPILGSLLAGSLTRDGGAMQLTFGMGGFGLALALPFALFALFPNWLNSLPKSGGWLNSVKVVLGFVEVALSVKFLSNADLVMHWGILKREVFIGIWVLCGLGIVLYLLGKIKFPHDSPIKKLSKARIALAISFAAFTIYLVPGLTNTKWANLTLISGFPPPLYYSVYQSGECILNLNCSHDYEEGLKMAKAQNKPVLIDFTGYACVNCRRMEENVWSNPEVYKIMMEKYIVISLYVDDKKKLPAAKQFTYTTKEGVEREIISVGDKWATFETENFKNNAQPLYAILNSNEILLNNPVGYTPSIKEYREWLLCGLDAFEKAKK